ncbi:MAG: hypothetical protein HQ582_28840 [Planctomycetes bacterium]|nr:hypothetical protein [Planctomycetota bacterium]
MSRDEELPIIRSFYDFVLWVSPKVAKFPRDRRFVLGERMERQLYGILENLIRAKYTRASADPGTGECRPGDLAFPASAGEHSASV